MSAPEGINWLVVVAFLVGLAHELWARGNERECRRRAARWATRIDVLVALKTTERMAKEHWEEKFGLIERLDPQQEEAHEHD